MTDKSIIQSTYKANENLAVRVDFARLACGANPDDVRDSHRARETMRKQTKKRIDKENQNFRLQMMVSRHYAALHSRVQQKVQYTHANIYEAMMLVQRRIQGAEHEISELLELANKLSDGTPVFRFEDGRIETASGRQLTDNEMAEIVWRDDAPSGEIYLAASRRLEDEKLIVAKLQAFDREVGLLDDELDTLEYVESVESEARLSQIENRLDDIDIEATLIPRQASQAKISREVEFVIPNQIPDYSQ